MVSHLETQNFIWNSSIPDSPCEPRAIAGGLYRKLRLLSSARTHTHTHTHKHANTKRERGWMLSSWSGMYEKNDTQRLTCPLDKEVHVSSFLLQPYPVTNTLPWACTPTHTSTHTHTLTYTHTQPWGTGTSTSTVGLRFSPFCCLSPLHHL